jgi:hypothetical protein
VFFFSESFASSVFNNTKFKIDLHYSYGTDVRKKIKVNILNNEVLRKIGCKEIFKGREVKELSSEKQ